MPVSLFRGRYLQKTRLDMSVRHLSRMGVPSTHITWPCGMLVLVFMLWWRGGGGAAAVLRLLRWLYDCVQITHSRRNPVKSLIEFGRLPVR